ncbi:glycolipid synthesis enzyme LtaA [Alkalihalophilus pseudofirmus OF4]|uniref:Glycolipid synthesis enzyme LtaA n=1 Tax=Alkalihalophilus pseudofirmus (strain ATCC BAA-2126 / JCM 17055 / OF4) TaxID=398511 RepID=D3FU29_ALKPO|nr:MULTISPECIES: MFS transporter [Alkalihalophilus]ADC48231.1 glycolipid synthesis enzyme LtaA [Alkalihalophilus pseudofirmus OF4]MED1602164.1 MFS transporter [Alkalihalophilus marmarensis]WEG15738.1 MFS transporter [Alkalihalophilus pseudofirmus]
MDGWKRNLRILVVCQFIVMSAMTMIIPFLPLYLKELGVTNPQTLSLWAGIIFGANFLTAFLFSPFWGRMADRHGRKMMILRSGFGMALVISLTGFATGPVSLLILRLLNGVISGFIPASIGLVSTNTPKEKVGYALGVLQSGTVAGAICGPLIGGVMAQAFSYQMVFFLTGLCILVAALGVLFFVRESFTPVSKEQKTSTKEDFIAVTKQKPVLSLYLVIFLIQLAIMGVNPLLSLFVTELTPAENVAFFAGLAISVMGFANMMTAPFLGKLSDKKGAHHVLIYSMLGVAMFSIPQAFVADIWQLIALRFMVGLCLGGLLPAANTLIRLHAPNGMESRTYGFSNSAMYLGTMIGPIIGGWIIANVGVRGLFLVCAAILLVNVAIVKLKVLPPAERLFMREFHQKKKAASH